MKIQKNLVAPTSVMIVALLVIGWIVSGPTSGQVAVMDINQVAESLASVIPFDSGMRIALNKIPEASTTVAAFAAIKTDAISKADSEFLAKYLVNYSFDKQPPVSQSKNLLSKYSKIISTFEANYERPYQCLNGYGETCPLVQIRNAYTLESLKGIVNFELGKLDLATSTAGKVIMMGRNLTANATDIVTLSLGWEGQKLGYTVFLGAAGKGTLTPDQKANLLSTLRDEHKKVIRYEYSRVAELVDYINSPKSQMSGALSPEAESFVNNIRSSATTTNWNPEKTKRYFYDSYKLEIANTNLACNATSTPTVTDFRADIKDAKTENFLGKMLYTTSYPGLSSLNSKRCEIENLINSL